MHKFKTMFAAAAATALILTGTAQAADPAGTQDVPATHHEGHDHHKQMHQHKHLTEEQKQALLDAGIDLKQLHANHDQIRAEFDNLRAHSKAIHEKVDASKDKKLQEQVKADLEPFRTIMGQLKESKQEYRDLKQELRAAADAKDKAKIKATFAKLQTNQQQIVKLLQAADKELQKELTKLK
ncbi:hypothetical protein EV586_105190 [Tumebacillus sp. BK434]|uniref:hypothetical protein n=1 Tax=Tumebacillus sp. BK434 TaxID=2512169 RepID=UPI001048D0C1|nr:hypothetical protein [Tumebacillus sp. BK434]TCP53845.1 hypothetical protein EV586_105190 [Tumebacillus sp. BK434]